MAKHRLGEKIYITYIRVLSDCVIIVAVKVFIIYAVFYVGVGLLYLYYTREEFTNDGIGSYQKQNELSWQIQKHSYTKRRLDKNYGSRIGGAVRLQ